MLTNCDTSQQWQERVETARTNGEHVDAVLLDAIAVAVKNQDIIAHKLDVSDHVCNETLDGNKDGTVGIKFVFRGFDNVDHQIGNYWFRPATDKDEAPVSSLVEGEDPTKTARVELAEIFKGVPELSFTYTPFILMVTRMFDIDIDTFRITSDNNTGKWAFDALAHDRVIHVEVDRAEMERYATSHIPPNE